MAIENRIGLHPILDVPQRESVTFYWKGRTIQAKRGEVIASALIANGIDIFGYHHKDDSPQGMFCANGQCAKCTVIANGMPVKSCVVKVLANMRVEPLIGLPKLPEISSEISISKAQNLSTDVLIIGGGPAGLSAAIEIAKRGLQAILIDDKSELGGKLVLQTHKFFGSTADSYAGTRGIEIGKKLAAELIEYENCSVWLNSTVLYIFKDKKVGVLKDGVYKLIEPKVVLNTAGAREKYLRFPGNSLPGIYGAGAFQTLVNRDLVIPSKKLFIIGGGNVGLIAGYHALQAGIEVVGLVEAQAVCGGYKVHADKLKRLGVPIYTSHTVVEAIGTDRVEGVTIVQVDENYQAIAGTEKSFYCDTILVAVGLEAIDEFSFEAKQAGMTVFAAGDSEEIAEASSAMFNGRIVGMKIAQNLGIEDLEIKQEYYDKAEQLKKHPGEISEQKFSEREDGVYPVIHCLQEIPCNPCSTVCPLGSIELKNDPLMGLPGFKKECSGCHQCLLICPGLAITLVDYRKDKENPIVTLPYELSNYPVKAGDLIKAVDINGNHLAELPVISVIDIKKSKTQLIKIQSPKSIAQRIVSFSIQKEEKAIDRNSLGKDGDEAMVCLCERVTVGDVRKLIKQGVTDINQIKALTRLGMGPCGSKTCDTLIRQIFREEGVKFEDIIANTKRPVFIEVPLQDFVKDDKEK